MVKMLRRQVGGWLSAVLALVGALSPCGAHGAVPVPRVLDEANNVSGNNLLNMATRAAPIPRLPTPKTTAKTGRSSSSRRATLHPEWLQEHTLDLLGMALESSYQTDHLQLQQGHGTMRFMLGIATTAPPAWPSSPEPAATPFPASIKLFFRPLESQFPTLSTRARIAYIGGSPSKEERYWPEPPQ